MTETMFAWAAGLFEGEGSFTKHTRGYPVAQMDSVDEDVVRRFHEVIGCGKVYKVSRLTVKGKQVWKWYAYNNDAIKAAHVLLPYLGERRRARWATLSL